jgi:hypothetical protein
MARRDLAMTVAVEDKSQASFRGRPTKFTPERMQQICNLVERGKSREEIAEIIGVTTGTLQVTCSKLGISLRRPRFDIGTGLLPRQRPGYQKNASPTQSSLLNRSEPGFVNGSGRPEEEAMQVEGTSTGVLPASTWRAESNAEARSAVLAIRIEYKGRQRSTDLPLDAETISQLAIEAEIQGMRIGELVAALIEREINGLAAKLQ